MRHVSTHIPTSTSRPALLDGVLFILHAEAARLSAQPLPAPSAVNNTNVTTSVSTAPLDAPANATFLAVEMLLLNSTGTPPVPRLYVATQLTSADRGPTDNLGDAITVFSYHAGNGSLVREADVRTGLAQIRGMAFSPAGEYLVAGGEGGAGGVAVFERVDDVAKGLVLVARDTAVQRRTSFVWLTA